ncbi:hypothetical protein DENSPDRAFT_933926 [Dentipellis sp. KUC8613]|nr:hypothetical protein DENSPDRAFT_933926 [Dentipellis sp. KUC8613]
MTEAPAAREPYIRLATPADLEALAELATAAFIDDAVLYYWGGIQSPLVNDPSLPARQHFHAFQRHTNLDCFAAGSRTTVVAVPSPSGSGAGEEIIAMTIFLPPRQRMCKTIEEGMRSGIMDVVVGWGESWLQRLGGYMDVSVRSLEDAFRAKGVRETPLDVWYLQVACVHPQHQRKGYLTKLVREMYAFAPNSIMTLDSTSAKSKAVYEKLGFEVVKHITSGEGSVNEKGLPAEGEEAKGVSGYSMVKWADRS